MRPTRGLKLFTGRHIRRLICGDNRVLEEWNDDDSLKGDKRDRLGAKEARFQSLLAQTLRENAFDVVVESYLNKDSKKKYFSSCDLYAWDRRTSKSYWIEIKRQDLTPQNNNGGKDLVLQVFSDMGKILAGKDKTDIAVIWIGFFGSAKHVKQSLGRPPLRFKFQIGSVTTGKLKAIWRDSRSSSSSAKKNTKRLLGGTGGSVSDALLDLAHWIKANGGVVMVREVEDRKNHNKQEWVRYGIFCGMLA